MAMILAMCLCGPAPAGEGPLPTAAEVVALIEMNQARTGGYSAKGAFVQFGDDGERVHETRFEVRREGSSFYRESTVTWPAGRVQHQRVAGDDQQVYTFSNVGGQIRASREKALHGGIEPTTYDPVTAMWDFAGAPMWRMLRERGDPVAFEVAPEGDMLLLHAAHGGKPFSTSTIDPSRDHAVTRVVVHRGGTTVEARDFAKHAGDVWLPRRLDIHMTGPDGGNTAQRVTFEQIATNRQFVPADFDIAIPTGTTIADMTTGVQYDAASTPGQTQLHRTAARAKRSLPTLLQAAMYGTPLLFAAACVLWLLKRQRRPHAPHS